MTTTASSTSSRTVTLDIDLSELSALIDTVLRVGEEEGPGILADAIRADTIERQSRGVGASGDAWQPYTARYAKRRQKLGLQVSFVDHRVTGQMLDSYAFDKESSMLTVPDELKPQAEGTSDRRNWIEPSEEAIERGCAALAARMEGIDGTAVDAMPDPSTQLAEIARLKSEIARVTRETKRIDARNDREERRRF